MEMRLQKTEWIGERRHLRVERRRVASFPLHAHDYFEVEIVLAGEGKQNLNGREYRLRRGSVTWLSPADVHEVTVRKELLIWNLSFDDSVVSVAEVARLSKTGEHCRQADEKLLKKLDAASFLLREEEQTHGEIRPLMEYVLTLCIGRAREEALSPIQRAALFIETHFRESPSLSDAARLACLSPVYFGERFKKETGKTYVQFLNACKLRYACQLLSRGLSVADACFTSGFGSLSGFLYTFKKQLGVTPEEYRHASLQETKKG